MRKKLNIVFLGILISSFAVAGPIKDTLVYMSWEESLQQENPLSVQAIDLSKSKLDSLPQELQHFKNLRGLKLTKNKLTYLPDFFKDFKSLTFLHLNKNKLETFPYQVFHLHNLKYLDVSKNKISSIPAGIKSLQKLLYLDLWSNQLSSFPEELAELQQLAFLDARGRTYSPSFVESWIRKLPNTTIRFEKPCKCLE